MSALSRGANELFERIYQRLGWRHVYFAIALAIGIVLAMVALTMFVGYKAYFDATWGQTAEIIAITLGAAGSGIAVGLSVSWDRVRTGRTWLENPDGAVTAEEAWDAFVHAPLRLVVASTVFITVLAAPATTWYTASHFDFSFWLTVAFVVVVCLVIAIIGLTCLFAVDIVMRPVSAEIAAALPSGFRAPRSPWNVRAKTLSFPAAACLTASLMGASVLPDSASGEERLALMTVASLAFLLVLILPLSSILIEAIIGPIVALRDATDRVSKGDYSQEIPRTTADELGEAVAGFNHLQRTVRAQLDELHASRARIVAASDAERRRVERNLHDGAQQRLVGLALKLRMLEEDATADPKQHALAAEASEELKQALAELRELARGLHPQVLSTGGLKPALQQLAERSPVPVTVEAPPDRYPDSVESTAYFVVSEALANVTKYAQASRAEVSATRLNGRLVVEISDDGVGGADAAAGSGLMGLTDRVAALNGELSVRSPRAGGTVVTAQLPLAQAGDAG